MPSDNSNSWRPYFSSTAARLTVETPYWSTTASTRTFSTSAYNSFSGSIRSSQDSHSTKKSFTRCTTSPWPLCQSCGSLFLTLNTKRTEVIRDKLHQNWATPSCLCETHNSTSWVWTAVASVFQFSVTGFCTPSGTLSWSITWTSTRSPRKIRCLPLVKSTDSGFQATSFTEHVFLLLTFCSSSEQITTQFREHSSSPWCSLHTSSSSYSSPNLLCSPKSTALSAKVSVLCSYGWHS